MRREAELDRRRQIKALLDHHVSAQLWRELLEHAELAARGGEQELMLLRFPSDLCIDRGRLRGAFPGVAPAGRYPAPHPYGARTFLRKRRRPSGRLAWMGI